MNRKLVLKDFFQDVLGEYPEKLKPFLKCPLCCYPFYVIGAAVMDWSTNEKLFGNTLIEMDLHCEGPDPKPLPDTEIGWDITFGIGEIYITEVKSRWVETKPYRTHLERRRVVAQVNVEDWDLIRDKVCDFLLLPIGFED